MECRGIEVPATLQLYLDGEMEQFWLREKEAGVIFLMSVESVDEAPRFASVADRIQDRIVVSDVSFRPHHRSPAQSVRNIPGSTRM
jgi:hypothetical protein